MEITEIKQQLHIETVLNHYNLKLNKNHQTCCPFHDDKTPSLRIYPETNTYHCFGCGKTGDVIQFIQDMEGLDTESSSAQKHKAIKKAAALTNIVDTNKKASSTRSQITSKPLLDLEEAFTKMKQSLHRSKKAITYLESRNIYDVKLEQGYNNRVFPKLQNCIVYPLKNAENKVVSFYGRYISPLRGDAKGRGAKHYYLTNRQGLYPNYPTAETTALILTESIIDATTIFKYTDYSVLALYGTNGLTNEHNEALQNWASPLRGDREGKEIILFFDGDKAGREANKTISKKLHELLPKTTISIVDTPDKEDINSLLQGHEPEILHHLIKERQALFSSTENKQRVSSSSLGELDWANPEYIVYKNGALEISVLGGIPMHNLDKLKVTLRVSKQGNPSPLHILRQSNIDLYNDDDLTKLIRKLAERLELGTKEVQHALYNLITELENYRLKQIELAKPDLVQKRQLTVIRKEKAIAFLKSKNLLQKTNALIGKTGLVGEENNRLLMYLVFTSRLREQPLHIISLGASGTGKTYLQEKISELIPEDQKLEITALSENALYYFDRTELKNKLVLIEDLDGAQDDKILYAIRELMSKKRISKTIPIKDAKGNLKTITLQVEGPITLAGTTTKEKIYEDNANRSILIYLDNSKQHKEAIIKYQQNLSAGLINKTQENQTKAFLKDVQSVLEPVKVRNPYAPQLQIPTTVFKPLRTNAHYLAFIETVTFYHQHQRKRISPPSGELEGAYIETTIEDIEIANQLLKDVLLTKSDELTKGCRDFFEAVKRHLAKEQKTSFYSQQIRKAFRMSPNNVKYYLAILSKYNLVKVIGGHPRKQGYEYEIISIKEYEVLKDSMNSLNIVLEKIKKSPVLSDGH